MRPYSKHYINEMLFESKFTSFSEQLKDHQATIPPQKNLFKKLPDEMILKILEYIDRPYQLIRVSCVSTRFNVLANDREIWLRLAHDIKYKQILDFSRFQFGNPFYYLTEKYENENENENVNVNVNERLVENENEKQSREKKSNVDSLNLKTIHTNLNQSLLSVSSELNDEIPKHKNNDDDDDDDDDDKTDQRLQSPYDRAVDRAPREVVLGQIQKLYGHFKNFTEDRLTDRQKFYKSKLYRTRNTLDNPFIWFFALFFVFAFPVICTALQYDNLMDHNPLLILLPVILTLPYFITILIINSRLYHDYIFLSFAFLFIGIWASLAILLIRTIFKLEFNLAYSIIALAIFFIPFGECYRRLILSNRENPDEKKKSIIFAIYGVLLYVLLTLLLFYSSLSVNNKQYSKYALVFYLLLCVYPFVLCFLVIILGCFIPIDDFDTHFIFLFPTLPVIISLIMAFLRVNYEKDIIFVYIMFPYVIPYILFNFLYLLFWMIQKPEKENRIALLLNRI
ncbi:f-box only protein [Anaeramoeba flamelloides]|uniref:F-box only protein n=1 Tax=Anaeramoeba flamelloides TaxID=1746091 RepID=A0ABQ8Y3N0_9EUKA|nr:f-box only protein [Anaeramoeba flamelloides]